MAATWEATKSYSKRLLDIASGGGIVGGGVAATGKAMVTTTATVTTGTGLGSTTVVTTTTAAAPVAAGVAGGALAAAGGTVIGQGANWLITKLWDPVTPVRGWDPSGIFVPSTELEAKAFLYDLYGEHWWGFIPYLTHSEPSLGVATEEMLVKGIRVFIDAARGGACATAGQQPQVLLAKDALQADIAAYSMAIGNFAAELSSKPQYEFPTAPLTLAAYLQFIQDADTQGASAIPLLELIMIQKLLRASRVSWTEGDIGESVAEWVAEGATPAELAGFASHGNQLTTAQMFDGSRTWYWNRINLDESPLVNP